MRKRTRTIIKTAYRDKINKRLAFENEGMQA